MAPDVAADAQTLALVRELIARHPQAFGDAGDAAAFRAHTPLAEVLRTCSAGRAILRRWVETNLADVPPTRAGAEHIVRTVRDATVNQREVRVDIGDADETLWFWASTGLRLVRGQVNCVGQNELLRRLLRARFGSAHLFRTAEVDGHNHTLVRFEFDEAWLFADAWADAPLFTIDARTSERTGVPTVAALRDRGLGAREGVHPERAYRRGRRLPPFPFPEPIGLLRGALRGLVPGAERAAGADRGRVAGAYLAARAQHLFGVRREAIALYDAAARIDADDWRPHAARAFARRLADADGAH